MKKEQVFTFNKKDIESLIGIIPSLYALNQRLENVVSESILKDITNIKNTLSTVLSPVMEAQEKQEDEFNSYCNNLSTDYGLNSVWSVGEVDFNEKIVGMCYLSYKNFSKVINFEKDPTYLEFWMAADKLISNLKTDRIFVEGFSEKSPGEYELILGS